ncbi:MAG: lipid-A-disaccharide synthase, partial [Thermodesulfobacteriota bacterium]
MSPQNPSGAASVMIIAGETSGDQHGARLVAAMRKIDDNIAFFGIGGPSMEKEGVEIVVDAASLSVVGITEAFSRMPGILGGLSAIKRAVAKKRPGLVILIDFPDFNLHMARYVKRFSIPVLYYISPQVWAWRSGRIKKIRKYVDRMAVILPFEKSFYEQHGIPVTFVGHPLLDHRFGDPHDLQSVSDGEKRVIGLLPGSRHQEIARNLPVMLAAATHV